MREDYKPSEVQRTKWDKMLKKYGIQGMAKRVMKTKSYRAYKQRWPFDDYDPNVSLDDLIVLDNSSPSVEDIVSTRLEIDKIRGSLSPKTQKVFDALLEGKSNPEIEKQLGFNSNEAVRWQKNQVKQEYYKTTGRKLNEYVCRDCAHIYKDISPLECPKCGSRDLYKVSLG